MFLGVGYIFEAINSQNDDTSVIIKQCCETIDVFVNICTIILTYDSLSAYSEGLYPKRRSDYNVVDVGSDE